MPTRRFIACSKCSGNFDSVAALVAGWNDLSLLSDKELFQRRKLLTEYIRLIGEIAAIDDSEKDIYWPDRSKTDSLRRYGRILLQSVNVEIGRRANQRENPNDTDMQDLNVQLRRHARHIEAAMRFAGTIIPMEKTVERSAVQKNLRGRSIRDLQRQLTKAQDHRAELDDCDDYFTSIQYRPWIKRNAGASLGVQQSLHGVNEGKKVLNVLVEEIRKELDRREQHRHRISRS